MELLLTINLVILFLAVFSLSNAFFYLAWTKVRVTILRQMLFEIRDNLWDTAFKMGRFDDPAYKRSRSHLNNMIRLCGYYSIPTIMLLAKMEKELKDIGEFPELPEKRPSENPVMEAAIAEAESKASRLIVFYVLFWRVTGWMKLASLFFEVLKSSSRKKLESKVLEWQRHVDSPAVDAVGSIMQQLKTA